MDGYNLLHRLLKMAGELNAAASQRDHPQSSQSLGMGSQLVVERCIDVVAVGDHCIVGLAGVGSVGQAMKLVVSMGRALESMGS
jgi:hypothetical protein